MTRHSPRFVALLPAAGSGSRIGGAIAKQYLPLAGKPLIWHTVNALNQNTAIAAIYVVLSADDRDYARYDWRPLGDKVRLLHCGGASRAESVSNGLDAIANSWHGDDWILVHDAARPCLNDELIQRLIDELATDPVGGLLAIPVADTLKQDDGQGHVAATVPRAGVWQAQTPQMFRLQALRQALHHPSADITDEASAMEAAGFAPKLVLGDARNLKVTYPHDLWLAGQLLTAQAGAQPCA